MRRLFIPFLVLFALGHLAGCDSGGSGITAVGEWELTGATDHASGEMTVPVGSRLVLGADDRFSIESGNDCTGRYDVAFVINQNIFEMDFETCTEVGTTAETDLAILLGAFEADVFLDGPVLFLDDRSRMDILVYAPEASYTLRFRAI